MAEEKKNGNGKMMGGGMTCGCGCGGNGHHWTFFLLRTLVTIIILMMVFWFGVVAGRLADYSGAMRGYAMPAYGRGAMPMLQVNGATSTPVGAGGVQNY